MSLGLIPLTQNCSSSRDPCVVGLGTGGEGGDGGWGEAIRWTSFQSCLYCPLQMKSQTIWLLFLYNFKNVLYILHSKKVNTFFWSWILCRLWFCVFVGYGGGWERDFRLEFSKRLGKCDQVILTNNNVDALWSMMILKNVVGSRKTDGNIACTDDVTLSSQWDEIQVCESEGHQESERSVMDQSQERGFNL